jgi:hypothetical protein
MALARFYDANGTGNRSSPYLRLGFMQRVSGD